MKKPGGTILLVDDDKINNFINEKLIKKTDLFEIVKVVVNGQEAIDFLQLCSKNGEPSPEIILLDINMPVMDGFEFLHQYNKMASDVKINTTVIMLTTSTNVKDVEQIVNAGVRGYINKPLTTDKLLNILNTHLEF